MTARSSSAAAVTIRGATLEDGAAVYAQVVASGKLDINSPYAYLLLCSHFSDTTLVAELDGEVVGFVAAYVPPRQPDTVFVWQVGVDARARGQGLASRLLDALFEQPACRQVRFLSATVTPDNAPSDHLFRGFARRHGVPCEVTRWIEEHHFPPPTHQREDLYRIGPVTGR